MSDLNKGLRKVQITLKWDPSPLGEEDDDLDIIAATYTGTGPYGEPAYLVHFDSRSPDGTITLDRDSRTGQGLGIDEAVTLELERMAPVYTRVVVGIAIQQGASRKPFGRIRRASYRIAEGYTELGGGDFTPVADATAATVAEFFRDESGAWRLRSSLRGFDTDPRNFARVMGKE
ncbi:TerD family protein [Streptomyces sp. GC420]|uniref:TerD family protein n=1 Tax=Streptomyces sp. GC420 TaxID=2697568 RepID=UPI001414F3CD|nr:TerD family protein [Streptomyces sp. GC420]NBM14142.1 TerD-family protein [Streptomyces sp. GC420]